MGWNLIENLKGPTGPAGATGGTGAAGPTGPSVWGGISGTLSSQADLQAELDAKADLAGATFTGDIRTRPGDTGGHDVYARSFYAAPAGFYYITDPSGNRVGFMGPDGSPADYLVLGHGSGPIGPGGDDFQIDLTTGAVTIRSLAALNYGTIVTANLGDYDAAGAAAAALVAAEAYTDSLASTLGTAAFLNVPPSGNASSSQVAKGSDTRLARYPGVGFDGGGLALTGSKSVIWLVEQAMTNVGWDLLGDGVNNGSASILVEKSSIASFGTFSTLFTATCSGAKKSAGTGLNNSLAKGDVLRFTGSGFSGWLSCLLRLDCTP